MAKLASVFFVFMIQVLVLVTVTGADLKLDVHPSEIVLGTTSSLDINCSFFSADHPEMAAFTSLILSKTNMSGQAVEDIAAITQFSPDSATVVTKEKVTATGVHSQTGESFLHVTWDFPTATQAGVYQCAAHGMDILGQLVEVVDSSEVTGAQADMNDIFEKLKQMEKHVQALEFNNSQMSSSITYLQQTVASLQRFQSMTLIGTYDNHDYYVSKEVFTDIYLSIDICKSYGGQLVEVDNKNEFVAIQSFLKGSTDHPYYMIAGTDEATEGTWVFQSTNKPVPYIEWASSDPNGGTASNCLHFFFYDGTWKMADSHCQLNPPDYNLNIRYMCEILSV